MIKCHYQKQLKKEFDLQVQESPNGGEDMEYTVMLAESSQQEMWQGHKLSMFTSRNIFLPVRLHLLEVLNFLNSITTGDQEFKYMCLRRVFLSQTTSLTERNFLCCVRVGLGKIGDPQQEENRRSTERGKGQKT